MVEDRALDAFEDMSSSNDMYATKFVICMVSGNDVMGLKGVAQLSILD